MNWDPGRDIFEALAGPGVALGINAEWDYAANRKEALEEGQIIVLGTDGVWEARNPADAMFGREVLRTLIRENAHCDAQTLLDRIIDALDRFRDGVSLQDDVTLIVVKFKHN